MSLRRAVDRPLIDLFLRQLGERYRQAGRLYLVGGTTLVYEGFRQQTLDIDIDIEVASTDHSALIQAVRELKDRLDVNVEEASPGDFIPLPAGYTDRHVYLNTFGRLDVFHFDLYSTALSKVERGRRQDLIDVILLLHNRRIEWDRLERMFQELLPQMGLTSLRQDPEEFARNFETLKDMWRTAGGQS